MSRARQVTLNTPQQVCRAPVNWGQHLPDIRNQLNGNEYPREGACLSHCTEAGDDLLNPGVVFALHMRRIAKFQRKGPCSTSSVRKQCTWQCPANELNETVP